MAYQYIPPPTPAGYLGNEEMYEKHKKMDSHAALARHKATWEKEFLNDAVNFPLPKEISTFFNNNIPQTSHTEVNGRFYNQGILVAKRDEFGSPRDRFGNYINM